MEKTLSANSIYSLLLSGRNLHDGVISAADATQYPVQVTGLKGSLYAFFIRMFIERVKLNELHAQQYENRFSQYQKDFVIICTTQKEADEIESDLQSVLEDSADIYKLPWWGMIPYRPCAPGAAVFGERAGVLARMASRNSSKNRPRIFIVCQRALLTPVPPAKYTRSLSTVLKKGQTFDVEEIASRLSQMGYMRVPKVNMKGEFALRGEVLDIFVSGEKVPFRIIFDFDTIEQIKTFEVESQNTKDKLESILIYPMKEVVWTQDLVDGLEQYFDSEDQKGIRNDFASFDRARKNNVAFEGEGEHSSSVESSGTPDASLGEHGEQKVHLALTDAARKEKDRIITELTVQQESEGEELFYPVLWGQKYSILDYIPSDTPVFFFDWDRTLNAKKMLDNEYAVSYRTARQVLPVPVPEEMQLDMYAFARETKTAIAFRTLETLSNSEAADDGTEESVFRLQDGFEFSFCRNINIACEASQSYFGNFNYFKEQLGDYQREKWHVYIFADNPSQAVRIKEIVHDFAEPEYNDVFPVQVLPFALTSGFSVAEEKILAIQENEIFGRKRSTPKVNRKVKSQAINTFVELNPGDYVVHVNFGIGLFLGIERVKTSDQERDYIKLEYDDNERVFIPIEQVNMIQRYIGNEGEHPRVDRLGSKSWNARKAKVQQKVQEIAEKLIDLYSKRKASRGYPFPKDNEWNAAFEAAFPYEDTPDQLTATNEIKADMESSVPMDRLVCGDVGYGKTEIAMRAAFKACINGKQAAFLAPTTILAEQHYENCVERFKNFPVNIAHLSRFVSPAEQKKIIEKLKEGKIDLVVGTHRLLSKDVVFKDLGLMIIDEEQRFGVKDKEKLKVLKTNIDSLALSATPIPRTLHMSLLKIRDMSLLTTPPQNRHAIETAIEEYDDEKVARAIRNEVARGGQVFYLHNRVETLEETRIKLEKLVPEMMVDVAHGQMTSDELDDIFKRFKMGGFHILVATTIIENGIDIPNVNTIIIDRADMYGVSQLYQLRGRVGRSDRKAYAYLFYPENKVLSEVAMKRLKVISDFTELGSGFKIAMKDMEIRGAGNLLGRDQSGEVCAVGFEMYLNLLNSAIERLSTSNWQAPHEVLLELEYTGFIPDSYITDAQTKMEVYKKIASVQAQDELDSMWNELNDRFGPVPDEVASLLSLAKIRIICAKLEINSLREKKGTVTVEFGRLEKVNIDKALRLIKTSSGRIRLDPAKPNYMYLQTGSIDLTEKADFIKEKLEQLI